MTGDEAGHTRALAVAAEDTGRRYREDAYEAVYAERHADAAVLFHRAAHLYRIAAEYRRHAATLPGGYTLDGVLARQHASDADTFDRNATDMETRA